MSVTQDYKTLSFSAQELGNIEMALEDRVQYVAERLAVVRRTLGQSEYYTEQLAAAKSALEKVRTA